MRFVGPPLFSVMFAVAPAPVFAHYHMLPQASRARNPKRW